MKIIGIDTGVQTGFAIYCTERKELERVSTLMIHQALFIVRTMQEQGAVMKVYIEDARLATQGRANSRSGKYIDPKVLAKEQAKSQGVGSVKGHAKIWEDFLTDLQIPFQCVRPNPAITKWDAPKFKKLTSWVGRTSEHARDAAMIAFTKKS